MRRLVIYAHYDPEGVVRGYTCHMLAALRPVAGHLVFSSTAPLTASAREVAARLADEVRQIPNVGADVAMYRDALGALDAASYDEVLLVNSSTLGPVGDLTALVERMSAAPCDFWGMTDGTDNPAGPWNLQGYFLAYKRQVVQSAAWADFWARAEPLTDKHEIICRYEYGLTTCFTQAGFRPGCVVSVRELEREGENVTFTAPVELLSRGMPLVKVAALRLLPPQLVAPIREHMVEHGFDLGLVDEVAPVRCAPPMSPRELRQQQRRPAQRPAR